MKSIEVQAEITYQVEVDVNWREALSLLLEGRAKVAFIYSTDFEERIPSPEVEGVEIHRYPVVDGEHAKSASVANEIWEKLHHDGFTRSDVIVGIGGGAITDLAGFVAATWLRGIEWIAVPTSLAAMVDASVGGKTGINTTHGKNLVGAFHSPIKVIVDLRWLETLSARDFSAGLAEVIKCGFISDPEILALVADRDVAALLKSPEVIRDLIERSIAVKARVVSSDYKESELREILNYGHTFGHAVESAMNYQLRHGEAVAIGMIFIAELSYELGLIDQQLLTSHYEVISKLNLPTRLPEIIDRAVWDSLLQSMHSDKKARGNSIRFVTLTKLGETSRLIAPDEALMYKAYEKLLP